jgi:hypothetical protein
MPKDKKPRVSAQKKRKMKKRATSAMSEPNYMLQTIQS